MNRKRTLLFVRLIIFSVLFSDGKMCWAAETPAAPSDQIYDPDSLLARPAAADLSHRLKEFENKSGVAIYLALYTAPPGLIDEIAQSLNVAWNQTGYGVVVAFAPRRHQVRVLPSPQLSLLEDSDGLTKVFAQAAQSDLARGDDAGAAVSGVNGLMRRLGDVPSRLAPPVKRGWRFSRAMLLLILAGLAFGGLIILWITLRVLRAANIFDHSYRLPEPAAPAALRFGGRRCGGLLATSEFRQR